MLESRSSTADREQEILAFPQDSSTLTWLVRTEAGVAAGLPIVRRVLERLTEAEKTALAGAVEAGPPDFDRLVAAYRNAVSVSNETNTLLLNVAATAPEAELARQLAAFHATAYMEASVERRQREAERLLGSISTELALIDEAQAIAEAEANDIRAGAQGLAVDSPEVAGGRLAGLLGAIEDTRDQLLERQLDLQAAETAGPFELGADLASVAALQIQLANVLMDFAAASRFAADASPELQRLESRRNALLEAAREATAGVLPAKRAALAATTERLARLSETASDLQAQIRGSTSLRARLAGLEARVVSLDARRSTLIGRRAQIEGMRAGIVSEATLVEPALLPLRPDWPRPKLASAFGSVVGGGLGLAFCMWRDRRRSLRLNQPAPAQAPLNGSGFRHGHGGRNDPTPLGRSN